MRGFERLLDILDIAIALKRGLKIACMFVESGGISVVFSRVMWNYKQRLWNRIVSKAVPVKVYLQRLFQLLIAKKREGNSVAVSTRLFRGISVFLIVPGFSPYPATIISLSLLVFPQLIWKISSFLAALRFSAQSIIITDLSVLPAFQLLLLLEEPLYF